MKSFLSKSIYRVAAPGGASVPTKPVISPLDHQTPVAPELILKAPLDEFRALIVLDASGSMAPIKEDMIGSINEFITQQKKLMEEQKTATYFTLQQFSNDVRYIQFEESLANVIPITGKDYNISGNTGLFDGIGDMIERFQNCTHVACVIVTDGQENASTSFTQKGIKKLIEKQQKEKNWDFIYLSQDAAGFTQGATIGIQSVNNLQCAQESFSQCLSNGISNAVTSKKIFKGSA